MQPSQLPARLRPHLAALVPGLLIAALFLVWAAHDGGFDEDTWYWGALAALAILGATIAWLGFPRLRPPRVVRWAILLFALYVAWSYLSIIWAQAPGVALDGSNRALLYLILFTLMALLPWTVEAATAALVTFAIGVGVIGLVILFRLASTDHVASLFVGGRLASPTGYDNGTAALFCTNLLVCVGLAARRELPAPLRGFLLALGAASLQLAVVVQSRGWLFTLPIVIAVAAFVVSDRLRVAAASVLPILASVIPIHRLLAIYNSQGAGLNRAASHAGQEALLLLLGVFVLGTLLAWADQLAPGPRLSSRARRIVGVGAVAVAIAGGCAGLVAVAHGRPFHFIADQWNGFSKIQAYSPGSHFTDVGSGRYDFWRVALDGFLAHPIGGLGQDNFADYYLPRGRTPDQPEWAHSLELRLLAHTGIVGFVLFAGFIVLAIVAAVRSRRRGPPFSRAIAGVALLPL
ncbi:MAG: O-antigen ligase family protein, partial [Solirubrobacteraceae bacterium]